MCTSFFVHAFFIHNLTSMISSSTISYVHTYMSYTNYLYVHVLDYLFMRLCPRYRVSGDLVHNFWLVFCRG